MYSDILCLVHVQYLFLRTNSAIYQFGLYAGHFYARIIDRLYLHDTEDTFLRKGIDDVPKSSPDIYSKSKKLRWALEVIMINRGVGWNWEIPNLYFDVQHRKERGRFILIRLQRLVKTIFQLLFVNLLSKKLLQCLPRYEDLSSTSLFVNLMLRVFITFGWLAVANANASVFENVASVFFVGIGALNVLEEWTWTDPTYWPASHGNFGDAYSLRRFWGRVWYQNFRHVRQTPGFHSLS